MSQPATRARAAHARRHALAWTTGVAVTLALALSLGSCSSLPQAPAAAPAASAPGAASAPRAPASAPAAPASAASGATAAAPRAARATSLPLRPSSFARLPGWASDDFQGLWSAWRRDCQAHVALLAQACAASADIPAHDTDAQRAFFEQWFRPWRLLAADGADQGLVTGYFEPIYAGSTTRGWPYVVPLWGLPRDLVALPATASDPQQVTRGRVVDEADGRTRIVPFWSRAQIRQDAQAQRLLSRHVVAWLDNPVDALLLGVQGSGLVRLPDGALLRVSFAGDNGWPYRSIGRWLLDHGDLRGTVTMQSIRAWAHMHPNGVQQMLDADPRVVFFRASPLDNPQRGPLGALGVPLTAMRSVAVDKRLLDLGMPLWLSTSVGGRPLQRLVFAQDVGGAIRGALRADLFFGTGEAAGDAAGRMQSPGSMWLLLPRRAAAR